MPISLTVAEPEPVALGTSPPAPVRLDAGEPRGAASYTDLSNKPSIEGVTLVGDRALAEFGERPLSNIEIKELVDRVFKEE